MAVCFQHGKLVPIGGYKFPMKPLVYVLLGFALGLFAAKLLFPRYTIGGPRETIRFDRWTGQSWRYTGDGWVGLTNTP